MLWEKVSINSHFPNDFPAPNPCRDATRCRGYWGTQLTDKLSEICILISFRKASND